MTVESSDDHLKRIIAILKLAHRDALAEARVSVLADKGNAAILDVAADWTPAGKLKTAVMKRTKQSKPTVERRIAKLLDDGILEKQGGGSTTAYRSTGLV
jgi:hypothetical protein